MKATKTKHGKATRSGLNRQSDLATMPDLMTVPEVAAWLGVSQWSAYDMARRNILPAVRLGRLVRIQRSGLERLAGVHTAKAAQ